MCIMCTTEKLHQIIFFLAVHGAVTIYHAYCDKGCVKEKFFTKLSMDPDLTPGEFTLEGYLGLDKITINESKTG